MKTLSDHWDDPAKPWPSIVYVETTNYCNAKCLCCLNHRCRRTRGTMSMELFRRLADLVKERGLQIGAMFCFGEPLIDRTLTEKYAYARALGILPDHVGLNTNCTFLTPERYEGILQHTPNIILSFFSTGAEYERLTGLSWEDSYGKALEFIRYRDRVKPFYPIFIGCNAVKGNNLAAVKQAFAGYNVAHARDAEIRWGGSVITGVIDRTIMYHDWRCDGFKGALQVKWNGDCEFCAYDVIGSPAGGETKFGNILEHSWDELRARFVAKWRSGCSLCLRCDYWHKAKEVFAAGMRRPDPLPDDWYDWQLPYLKEGEPACD